MLLSETVHIPASTLIGVDNGAATADGASGCPNSATDAWLLPPEVPLGGVAIEDLCDLLSAVITRMMALGSEGLLVSDDSLRKRGIAQISADVRDCAGGLDQLHRTLLQELLKLSQLKLDVAAAQAALARQHVELIGTRAQERRARHMSRHDSLTLLPNRSFFSQRLDQALAEERAAERPVGLAVLFLDLDGFKLVNDTHGHDVGDQVLKIVATRLRQVVRVDDLVGRLGGDEFACMLADFPGRAQIAHHVSKVFDAVCLPMSIGELRLMIQPSIGIAVSPDDGITALELLKHADAAMYQTKRSQSGFAFLS